MNEPTTDLKTATPARSPVVVDESEDDAVELVEFEPWTDDVTDFVAADSVGAVPPFPHPLWHPLRAIAWIVRTLFGIVSLILTLAVLAAIPIVNFLALGYLLEVEGRLARTGKWRNAFPLLDWAPRIGSIVLGVLLWIFPVWILAGVAADARLIDPTSAAAKGWGAAKLMVAVMVSVHLCLALARGGSWGCFFRPLKNVRWLLARLRDGDYWTQAEQKVGEFIDGLRLKHHFWLGVRGFFGAAVWLFIPTALYASADKNEDAAGALVVSAVVGLIAVVVSTARKRRLDPQFELRQTLKFSAIKSRVFSFPTIVFAPLAVLYMLLVLLGGAADDPDPVRFFRALFSGIALAMVLSWLPFLQARFAAENRLGAMFELSTIRKLFNQSPVMWLFAVVVTFVLALPLYLAKVRLPPEDAMWLVTTIFIVSIYPARVLTGWAYHRAVRRGKPAWFGLRWISRGVMIPLLAFYVFLLFFTQYIGQDGKWTLYANHAFLLPAPF